MAELALTPDVQRYGPQPTGQHPSGLTGGTAKRRRHVDQVQWVDGGEEVDYGAGPGVVYVPALLWPHKGSVLLTPLPLWSSVGGCICFPPPPCH